MSSTLKQRHLRVVSIRRNFDRDFIDGVLSILGIEITEERPRSRRYDGRAIASDWEKVGQDIRRSMEAYSQEKALV